MRITVNVDKGDERYNKMMGYVDQATDSNLVIVARGSKNRKDDRIKPISTRNGIYFYIANDVDGALVYPSVYTAEDIEKAKENTIRRTRFGGVMSIMFGSGVELRDFELDGPMNVITSEDKTNGAGILYCAEFMAKVKEKLGDGYILPSSIHELIFVPADFSDDIESLRQMVTEINAGVVEEQDFLADDAWRISSWM